MRKPVIKRTKKTQPADKPPVESEMVPPQRKVRIVSLFSGAGGLEIAACRTGKVEAIVSTDSNATFLSTVEKNMPTHFPEVRHAAIVSDARELKGKTMRDLLGTAPDIVMGGPPCDDYTSLGKKRGLTGDKGLLIFEFLRLVNELKPKAFVFENVPNLTRQFKQGFEQFLTQAGKDGYLTKWHLLKACDFGAPTLRTRVFVVGWQNAILCNAFRFPEATHVNPHDNAIFMQNGRGLKPYILISDVLNGLPDVNTPQADLYFNHTGRKHRSETIEQFKNLPEGKSSGRSYRYRAPFFGLTQSLTAGLDNRTKTYLHPHYHREMTVREYARIHLFPDSWRFAGTPDNGNKQVANSVPIPLGHAVLEAIISTVSAS